VSDPALPAGLADPLPFARALIQRPSVTPEDAGAIGLVARALDSLGFTCHEIVSATGGVPIRNLFARRGPPGPTLCFAGHTDVVPPGQGWTVDPFAATIADGKLIGRGALDMKGAIACFVAALARRGDAASPPVSLLITGDEEGPAIDGTRAVLDWLSARGERLAACVVGEPTSPRRLGEMIKIGRRGSLNARLVVHGTQGHSAYPHLADNPIPRLLRLLGRLTDRPLDEGTAHFQPSTLVLTTVDVGNPATNVIPGEARAGFNIRFNDRHSGESLSAWIAGLVAEAGGQIDLGVEVSGEAFLTPPGALSAAVAAAIRAETGIEPEMSTSGGTSDARFIRAHCPVVEFGLAGGSLHKADEFVPLADLEGLSAIYTRLLGADWGGS